MSMFSAFVSRRAPTGADAAGETLAWSVKAGPDRHALMPRGARVGEASLGIVHFARGVQHVTDAGGTRLIAAVRRNVLEVEGPGLSPGTYAVARRRLLRGALSSSISFDASGPLGDVLHVRELTHTRRTVRRFDLELSDTFDPYVALTLLLIFGCLARQGILGELLYS